MFLTMLKFTAVSLVITALVALGLILSDRLKNFSDAEKAEGLDFESTVALGISDVPPKRRHDGQRLGHANPQLWGSGR